MKKVFLSTLMIAATASSVFAQDATKKNNDGGAFVRVGVGYALSHAGDVIYGTETYSATSTTYDSKKGSYGAGFNGIVAGGYMFNQHIGVELGVGVGIAMKKFDQVTDYNVPGSTSGSDNYTSTSTTYAKMPILIMPSVVLATGNTGLEGYVRAGLTLPVAGKIINEYEMTDRNVGGGSFNATTEYKPAFSVGLQGALGARYHISDMLNIWAEVNAISASAYVKSSEITAYEFNGVSEIGSLTVADRETEYEMNYTENGTGSTSTPTKAAAFSVPFSNIGISVGVGFRF